MAGIDRPFDYLVPADLGSRVRVGTSVRVPLHGRRVAGWVVEDDVVPPPGVRLLPLAAVRGAGPGPEVVEVAGWAARRWAGRIATVLKAASAPRLVPALPPPAPWPDRRAGVPGGAETGAGEPWLGEAFSGGGCVLQLGPASDRWPVVETALDFMGAGRSVLVLCPNSADAEALAGRLRRRRLPVALVPEEWDRAATGGSVVVGARGAAWAPAPALAAAVVLDGHDEGYKEERNPCWSAWEVVARRVARTGAPLVITSPCPTAALRARFPVRRLPRPVEREGWPVVEVIDRRGDDPRTGLISERLVGLLRGEGSPGRPVVAVLNRKGRARLLACRSCGSVAACSSCGAALVQAKGDQELRCDHCGQRRPVLCQECGATRLSLLRPGVSRLAEELTALAGRPVIEVSSDTDADVSSESVLIGTEAALHRIRRAAAVAFIDFDQELTAPRYSAAETAMGLIVRAGRLVGGRPGRVLVQTRLPDHEVLRAASAADPGVLFAVEDERRSALGLPPYSALALITGSEAAGAGEALGRAGLAVAPNGSEEVLVRAPDADTLADALGRLDPAVRSTLRVEVDPPRV